MSKSPKRILGKNQSLDFSRIRPIMQGFSVVLRVRIPIGGRRAAWRGIPIYDTFRFDNNAAKPIK